MMIVKPGHTTITLSKEFETGKGVGLVPIGQPVSNVSTTGLKWDIVPEWELSMFGLISTSNETTSDKVEIKTEKSLVWCAALS